MEQCLIPRVYDDEFLLETFSTLNPSVAERTRIFNLLWEQWSANKVKIDKNHLNNVRPMLHVSGLKEMKDFQYKRNEVRFPDKETMAIAMLVIGDFSV